MVTTGVTAVVIYVGRAYIHYFFFFQAEDGIRDLIVTGVQTCALPIYLRTEPAHHVEHVAQQRVAWPHPERFRNVLGVTEVVRPGEELAGPVDAASGEQLLRTDHAQLRTELRADQVLAALAPAERQIGHLRPQPPREQRHEIRVLVVGVRADHQDPLGRPELAQGIRQRRDAAGAGRAVLPQGRADGAEKDSEASPERAPHYGER